jgi:putative colanic acid biosynthesis glycosyltransferase
MKISVVTIVYNDREHIGRTIDSVLSQTARSGIEYIIIDGASTDGTSELIKQRHDEIDVYLCEKDTGIYNAMNKGLRLATGDYVIFINSGDKFSSETTIENILSSIKDICPKVAYGHYREYSGDSFSKVIPCRNYNKIWYGPVTSHQSMLYSLSHIRNNWICYDETYKIAADYKFTSEAIKSAGDDIVQLDLCISDFDISGVSSTNQNLGLKEANRVRREVFGQGTFRISLITLVLLGARYTKKYLHPLYKLLRNRYNLCFVSF